ncbi:TetR/AcrR family transcriptional regulator [Microbacterium saperdae]|uniref:TetR family transcriptional regulator n=1 Tax=Microbacterium saperdae TaxID=69368 RepID=A0A543BL41_9MICO|nr:TetR/AcrR family transcriptional regulator [Microbacterium saperdae]TQL85542.1 TetR family transcriptional regulator [Microbacterium saperdae]GGM63000.1 hypothetical protein GCM10010489_38100 [Microbacterium saperdae]
MPPRPPADAEAAAPRRAMRADARRNRERLLIAAHEVFTEKPHEASMDDVAKRAGVGTGTLFRNFPTRIDLIRAIYEENLQQLGALAAEISRTREPWEGLVEWLHAFVVFSQMNRAIIGELNQAANHDPEFDRRTTEQIDTAVGNVLKRAHAAHAVDPDLTARDLVQLIGGLVLFMATDDTRNDYLLGLIVRGIQMP